MATLAEAISLQGRPRTPSARQFLGDIIRIDAGQQRQRQLAERQQREREEEMEKLIYSSADVDYNKIHPFLRSRALGATRDYLVEATGYADQPNARLRVGTRGEELKEYLAGLNQASTQIKGLEDYASKGGYLSDDDQKVLNYFRSGGNPLYIQDYNPARSAAITGFDPNSGQVSFAPFDKLNLEAYATKNYFTPKERLAGREGRYDIIQDTYDPEEVKDLAFQDVLSNDVLFQNALLDFREQAIDELQKETNPLTGRKLFPEITPSTLQDPTFIEEFRTKVGELYSNWAAGLGVPSKEKLRRIPQPRTSGSRTTNLSFGGSGNTLTDFGYIQDTDNFYRSGDSDLGYTAIWQGSTQPVSIDLSGDLFNATTGRFEREGKGDLTGVNELTTAEIEIAPIYISGANKGKPVPKERMVLDEELFTYQPIINLLGTKKDALNRTINEKYIVPLEKAKTGYLLGLTKDEKTATQLLFKRLDEEVKRLNNENKSKPADSKKATLQEALEQSEEITVGEGKGFNLSQEEIDKLY